MTHRSSASIGDRVGRLGLALAMSLSLQLVAARPTVANTHGRLECLQGTGAWRVYLPAPGTLTTFYWSKFAFKFEGAWSGTGYDWRYSNEWFTGDTNDGRFWTAANGTARLPTDSWAYGGMVNSGKMIVWEYQYFPSDRSYAYEKVGECDIYQYMPFIPAIAGAGT